MTGPARLVVLALALASAGCDPIVEQAVGPPVAVVKEVSCEKLGVCYTCGGVSLSGKADICGMMVSLNCPGVQAANVIRTTTQRWHKSGATSWSVDDVVVSTIGACR